MKKKYYLTFICLVCAGCKNNVPNDYMQPTAIANMVVDMKTAESYAQGITNSDSSYAVLRAYKQAIYNKYKTDSAGYMKNLKWYAGKKELMDSVFNNAMHTAEAKRNALTNLAKKPTVPYLYRRVWIEEYVPGDYLRRNGTVAAIETYDEIKNKVNAVYMPGAPTLIQ